MLIVLIVLLEDSDNDWLWEKNILIKINDSFLTKFVQLKVILNTSMRKNIDLLVQQKEQNLEICYTVDDFYKIISAYFVIVSDANFQDLSYQLTRQHVIAAHNVYICQITNAFKSHFDCIILLINIKLIRNLNKFIKIMKSIADKFVCFCNLCLLF